ncbi:hypothetical protein H2198_000992 [Neophaeococcomyces mojaviensis]|uniref:Uncharacterized protein n=1 Tax=Neophaeococcomyces mojaviensis TaxID=3383035 RepID=A0ACC3AIE5_9EURO|nr:hypothetical protein H2198_000992 [Knufia sp. JES_112]
MRLIDTQRLVRLGPPYLFEFAEADVPKYVILSHRWSAEEVTFQELVSYNPFHESTISKKFGFQKIFTTASVAIEYGYDWIWCDTCCIDKTSSAELTEAINSMYRWYKNSDLCFAYLADVQALEHHSFTRSVWFTRCWTLQELIAPMKVFFFDQEWNNFGHKHELAGPIAERTGIDELALLGKARLDSFTIAQKMSWASSRVAQRTEDVAYSLLGIFDVNMPMLYGEGRRAFLRLQEEIMQRSTDQSILLWNSDKHGKALFGSSPADFRDCGRLHSRTQHKKAFILNNLGLDIEVTLRPWRLNTYVAFLACESGGPSNVGNINLEIDRESGYLCRTHSAQRKPSEKAGPYILKDRRITILRQGSSKSPNLAALLYGFRLANAGLPLHPENQWDPAHVWDLGVWRFDRKDKQWLFAIPEGVSTSIAMLTLEVGDDKFLIQITYDFDFNPAVHISRMTFDFVERFRRKRKWATDEEEIFTWADKGVEADWTSYLRYQDTLVDDPDTMQRCWLAKSIERQEFTAIVPATITKPHTNFEISFSTYPDSMGREWQFAMRQN